ncbi:MAG: hypothetical protein JRH20_04370 [Deltaproteobacteria bacterium]|nr:hypothetical protein [Deltaproteobacteria bacterium]
MQYTTRNIPSHLDQALREQAKREGKSLNEVTINALLRALGLDGSERIHRKLDDVAGTWVHDPEIDEGLDAQRKIDPDLWG